MTLPVIVAVDSDPARLDVLARDVDLRYRAEFRLERAEGIEEALAACSRLRDLGEPVALLVAAERLPAGSGIVFLNRARALHPDAGRILLTPHTDVDAAMSDVNEIGISRYLVTPWGPPEDTLYPALDETVADWRARAAMPYLRVRRVMEPTVASIRDDATMYQAAEMVASTGVGDLMVLDAEGAFVGVLSEGDILRCAMPDFDEILRAGGTLYDSYQLFMRKSAELHGAAIGPLVIADPLVVHPEDHVAKAAIVLIERQIRRLPVVEDGRLLGTVSRADICRATVGLR